MATNPYFNNYNSSPEQNLVEDLTVEIIKTMGNDMIYLPRTLGSGYDEFFGEDNTSTFNAGYEIEMYIQSIDGFEGEQDILSKFGIEIRDKVSLLVSRKRFNQAVGGYASLERPREGDLIYFPLSRGLFEINFVEHQNPFYTLGKNYSYKLDCELFTYNHETFNTGFSEIDEVQTKRQTDIGEVIVPQDPESGTTAGDGSWLNDNDNDIFDFTDVDPFSGGIYGDDG